MSQSKLFDTFQIFLPQSVAATSYSTSLVLENSISSLMGEYVPDIRALSICIPAFCLKNKTWSLHFWHQKTYVACKFLSQSRCKSLKIPWANWEVLSTLISFKVTTNFQTLIYICIRFWIYSYFYLLLIIWKSCFKKTFRLLTLLILS